MKRTPLFVSTFLVLLTCVYSFAAGDVLRGDGSSQNPYLIGNLTDFNVFADPGNASTYWASGVHVELTNSISLSGRSYSSAVIAPDTNAATITHDGPVYSGTFNGRGFEISGLSIVDDSGNSNIGLFGRVENGVIENLGVVNCSIDAGFQGLTENRNAANFGGLCGQFSSGTVSNCFATGTIEVSGHSTKQANILSVGGLIGNFWGTMSNCYSSCTVTVSVRSDLYSQLHTVGGLCGYSEGSISSSYSGGSVTATASKSLDANPYIGYKISAIGGLCGKNSATVDRCFSSGPVHCSSNSFSDSTLHSIGGLIGYNLYRPVYDSYTTSTVSASASADRRMAHCREIGGLIGNNHEPVENCYAAASFSAIVSGVYTNENNQGGLCGGNWGTVTNCFWDTDVSGKIESAGGTGKTTLEMGVEGLYTAAGWDFDSSDGSADWVMSGGYPKLTWEPVSIVDAEEFALLAKYWQMTGCNDGQPCETADWNDDGSIDMLDLKQLAQSWLSGEVR